MPGNTLRKTALLFLILNLGIVLYGHTRRSTSELTVTFLDVGQGDAAVIQTPSGRVVLIDTGGTSGTGEQNQGRATVEPFLRRQGVNHIDAILLTHPHADHIGGADSLIDDIPTDLLVDNGEPTEPALEQHLLSDARSRHVAYEAGLRSEQLDLGDGIVAELLAPTRAEVSDDVPNNASIVVRLTYGANVFLFMGDAEEPEEADLLASNEKLACNVLKVGHHGSETSSTEAFIKAVHPQEAVVSVGVHNRYGHPSRDVITRLEHLGAHVDRTDEHGAITCRSDGVNVSVERMR